MDTTKSQPPFLRLPPEIRLSIYELLLHPSTETQPLYPSFLPLPAHYIDTEPPIYPTCTSIPNTLRIRAEDPTSHQLRRHSTSTTRQTRTTFLIHSGNLRTQCMPTTYILLNSGPISTAILCANAQLHSEASKVLYSTHTFDFDTHTEALIAFLGDLTPEARGFVKSVRVVKRALPYDKEFDRAEWATAMSCLRSLPHLTKLSLGIVAGKPGDTEGWGFVEPYAKEEFWGLLGQEGMEWVGQLMAVGGLRELGVEAVVEHCPFPRSEGMARFVRFSASVEGGFGEFLRGVMVEGG